MLDTPKGLRLHIGLFGCRNAGKSSLINALTNQKISIVSDVAGTTTDPVEKACELAPIGPVVFIDTAGVDDVGNLGQARVERTKAVLDWVDIAIVVSHIDGLNQFDQQLIEKTKKLNTPTIIVLNKAESEKQNSTLVDSLRTQGFEVVVTNANTKLGIDELRASITKLSEDRIDADRPLIGDLAHQGDVIVLVTPIDTGAPKGRLILPQVQTIRELLDSKAKCFVTQEDRVEETLDALKNPPSLVVADSQVIKSVEKKVPKTIPLTTFSTQFAYAKSDIVEMAKGTAYLSALKDGDYVLISETCSHHPQKDDIGRIKIPRWLQEKTGKKLNIEVSVGKDFPVNLSKYAVIIQCGGCIVTRRHMLARVRSAKEQQIPMTNYGLTISYLQGVIERVLSCHPDALIAYQNTLKKLKA